jgi:hypothetical protein
MDNEKRRIVVQYRIDETVVDAMKAWAKDTRRTHNAAVELLIERGLAAELADAMRLTEQTKGGTT